MKADEVKQKIVVWAEKIVDKYAPPINFLDKFRNSTLKLFLGRNISRVNPILMAFVDYKDDIDTTQIIDHYKRTLFSDGELRVDPRQLVPSDLEHLFPNRIILLKAEDLDTIFSC